ncbi:MAG: serine hydrolase, partial [Oscillospiraceae bacterium]|nr:serine hydrolase [Oscillospiraceae bacterium]
MKIKKILCAAASAMTASVLFISGIVSVPDRVSSDAVSDMDEFVRNYENFCEVHIRTMDGEELYSYNADTPLFSASLIKLPYAVFVCRELSTGKRSLDDTFVYT